MRSSVAFLLLMRVLPSVGQEATTAVCQDVSPRNECKGIQGTGKDRDICCAEDCSCTCGGDTTPENQYKDCFLTKIRNEPPGKCTGEEQNAACVLDPEPIAGTPCGIVAGVLDEDGMLCCPEGCGTCGGAECSKMPMSWVQPDPAGGPLAVDPNAFGHSSSDYCCMGIMDTLQAVCGVDGAVAPCRMPQNIPANPDTCKVDGIEGTVHRGGQMCCPLGCNICGTFGCGDQHLSEVAPGDLPWSTSAPAGATTSDYCCTPAFQEDLANQNRFCGDEGVEPPCLIPSATLPPRVEVMDTCGVDGMEGVANGNKCCPLGCGQCGGPGCGTIDMGYVLPTFMGPTPPFGAKSSLYCCSGTSTFTAETPVCGEGNYPPCYIPDGATAVPAATPGATPSVTPMDAVPSTMPMDELADLLADLPADNCNLPGMPGILDSKGSRCCPQGCGMCGGPGCGSVDMSIVAPTVYGGVPPGATSGAYCCHSGVDTRAVTCGEGDPAAHPPCFVPAAPTNDTCNVPGVQGVASDNRKNCCPLGCGQCGGPGCGSVPMTKIFSDDRDTSGKTASSYCCIGGAFETEPNIPGYCDEAGAEPPCFIPAGTPIPATPAPVEVETVVGGGDGDSGGDGSGGDDSVAGPTTPSPVDDGSTPRGGSFTPAPSEEMGMMGCKNVLVTIDDAEELNGIYVMDEEDELVFVKDDASAVLMWTYEEMDVDAAGMDYMNTTMNSTMDSMDYMNSTMDSLDYMNSTMDSMNYMNSTMNSTTNSTMDSAECGYWMLVALADGKFSMPMVSVQDCAMNPEDIDSAAVWMVQHSEDETAIAGVGGVECLDDPMTPSPSSLDDVDSGDGDGSGDPMSPSPSSLDDVDSGDGDGSSGDGDETDPTAPVATPAPVDDGSPPVTPPTADRAAPTTVDSSGSSSGLSTGEAVGVGVGVSAVAIVGAVGISRWAKGR